MLEERVPENERNEFIENAIRCMFSTMEQERFLRDLVEHNIARDEELHAIDEGLEPEPEYEIQKATRFHHDAILSDEEILELDELG
jgi:hypothetical protein